MTTRIPEGYIHRSRFTLAQTSSDGVGLLLAHDVTRLWASVVTDALGTDAGVSTNPFAVLGDPDVCIFPVAQGVMYFETYGTNALYLIGPGDTAISVTTAFRDPKATYDPNPQDSEKIIAVTGHTVIPAAVGSFQAFLPADPLRTRAFVKTDSSLALLSDGVDSMNFMPVAPFFPGYAAVETSDAIAFSTAGGAHVDNAWWIIDRRIPVDVG